MSQRKLDIPDFFSIETRNWFRTKLGEPTKVQSEAWPEIYQGKHTLVSAPTGTGKTLTAFLVWIDQLIKESVNGNLKEELYVIYISPLKSLAADIRDNLTKPLEGIYTEYESKGVKIDRIRVAMRTGDTTQTERRQMVKHPPHILITTPESLFLLLTSKTGINMLKTAKGIILDELHAVIETKRGAHLLLSIARLDVLCKKPLQRIGLSATIQPLDVAAKYLSPDEVSVIAPKMQKNIKLEVMWPKAKQVHLEKDSIWREIAENIVAICQQVRSSIAFVDGRRFAEKLSYYISECAGEGYAKVHHGSLSKEQRHTVEQALKAGNLKLLIATSSMELGIDVGEIDQVFQIGNPFSIASTMQRIGRAGHRPNQTSSMILFPRTDEESLYCGMTCAIAKEEKIENMRPPHGCFDIIAQHLVSMAAYTTYRVDEVMNVLKRAYPFTEVTIEEVRNILCMLAGDYEHDENVPVRPRVVYDRIHDIVESDNYSRMLAISSGGTIPDRGYYAVKTESGTKLGEVEEEFVFESRVGDSFLLGSFHWRIQKITKDAIIVIPGQSGTNNLPFWKGDLVGRKLETGRAFGRILRELNTAYETGTIDTALLSMGLTENCVEHAKDYVTRQVNATEMLPNDQTIIVEHFKDDNGDYQIMIHSVFGNRVNHPLAILLQERVHSMLGRTINIVSDDDGILLYPYDGKPLPNGLLYQINMHDIIERLKALLIATPMFQIMFRYAAGRALMLGASKFKRQPLWIQRIRGTQMLDSVIHKMDHPLIIETQRECLENCWDLDGLMQILNQIEDGSIKVREIHRDIPSPMTFILRQKTKESLMYNYAPTTVGISHASQNSLEEVKETIPPDQTILESVHERRKLPSDEKQLHSLLMIEGDLLPNELHLPLEWFESLERKEQVIYIEQGLWIPAEQKELYERAFEQKDDIARDKLVLRLLRYKGGHDKNQIAQRYLWTIDEVTHAINSLLEKEEIVESGEIYYHKDMYSRAQTQTIMQRRMEIKTMPSSNYMALLYDRFHQVEPPMEQLEHTIQMFLKQSYPIELWETVIFPTRVNGYREDYLDKLLAIGGYFYQITGSNELAFYDYNEIDWEQDVKLDDRIESNDEKTICDRLLKRGASFYNVLTRDLENAESLEELLNLCKKGIICTDSFVPVRFLQQENKMKKVAVRQRINAKVKVINSGRWDLVRQTQTKSIEEQLITAFHSVIILSRETAKDRVDWNLALPVLRIWEYTGKVRRGYFIEGLSGIQYILEEDFMRTMQLLTHPSDECIWINATDPIQLWGKVFPHQEGRAFVQVSGTYVALSQGVVIMVMERKGKVLRCFDESKIEEALISFAKGFKRHSIYCGEKKIAVKEYPDIAKEALQKAGFRKEMLDYVLYL